MTFRSERSRVRLTLAAIVLWAVASARSDAQQGQPLTTETLRAAIVRGLVAAPFGFELLLPPAQTGVRLLDVTLDRMPGRTRITVDLSQRTLTYDPAGDPEPLLDSVIASTAPLTAAAGHVEYRFLVDGIALDQFVSAIRGAPVGGARAANGDTSGAAVISAGHGWYWNTAAGEWRLQRDHYWGIVEDFINWDMAHYTIEELRGTVFEPYSARDPDRQSIPGASGRPAWQEGATYHVRRLGAPPNVWDVGVDDYARDINVRPLYANWIGSSVVISIHNNGGGGTGTETWFDTTNGQQAESERLAEIVNRHVVGAIRSHYDAEWPDRGLRSCNGCKGENRLAGRPAIILEVAFMDTRRPDNDALHDERFKQVVARAIRDGLHEWAGVRVPGRPGTN